MTKLTVNLPDDVKALAKARAAEAGYANVGEYLSVLIRSEAAGAPPGLTIDSDEELESLLRSRLDGRSVEMDEADFRRIREKFEAELRSRRGAKT